MTRREYYVETCGANRCTEIGRYRSLRAAKKAARRAAVRRRATVDVWMNAPHGGDRANFMVGAYDDRGKWSNV